MPACMYVHDRRMHMRVYVMLHLPQSHAFASKETNPHAIATVAITRARAQA
jgi:hypothetical protein